MDAKEEIRKAVEEAAGRNPRITDLPVEQEYTYSWTCPTCGSHVPSRMINEGGEYMEFCRWCAEAKAKKSESRFSGTSGNYMPGRWKQWLPR